MPHRFMGAILAALTTLALPAAAAAHATTTAAWRTCKPQATIRYGIYRIDNDLFAYRRGPSCITVWHNSFTVDRNYQPQPGGVVAYPDIRVGNWFGSRDPGSGFPMPVTNLNGVTLHLVATGRGPGAWLTDVDSMIYKGTNTRAWWRAELVIAIRHQNWYPGPYRIWRVKIEHHWYYVNHHITGGVPGWPLTVFWRVRQADHAKVRLGAFLHYMLRRHWAMPGQYDGVAKFGPECWSGCRHLHFAVTDTWHAKASKH
jgi:hypothetical protein